MKKTLSVCLVLQIMVCCFLSGCAKVGGYRLYTDTAFDYFDTVTILSGYEKNQTDFDRNAEKIKNKIAEYHRLYSIYDRYDGVNNLAVINESAGSNTPVSVDSRITDLLLYGIRAYSLTEGRVNIAMGSVLSLWHEARTNGLDDPEHASLPQTALLQKAAHHCNIADVKVDEKNHTVMLTDPEMSLDVGAIAKGYALEQTALWMEQENMTGYLLNLGGCVKSVGEKPDGSDWEVGLENPQTDQAGNPYIAYLSVGDRSVVSSGSYQRFYTVNGKKYHHIIDPQTLFPSEGLSIVTILCRDAALGDALSTGLFCMSAEQGKALISGIEGAEAMWVQSDGTTLYTDGFKDFCRDKK